MFISKWAYVALMIWASISGIFATSDEFVITNTILFMGSLICLEIRGLREQLEKEKEEVEDGNDDN